MIWMVSRTTWTIDVDMMCHDALSLSFSLFKDYIGTFITLDYLSLIFFVVLLFVVRFSFQLSLSLTYSTHYTFPLVSCFLFGRERCPPSSGLGVVCGSRLACSSTSSLRC